MKKISYFLMLVAGVGLIVLGMESSDPISYGSVTLSGGSQAGHFPEWWDLTAGDMVISFIYDATGLVDNETSQWQDHAWAALGVRSPCYSDFNPTWQVEGAGVWLATDYDEWQTLKTFDPDPPGFPTLDLDDKLILQKGGGCGEGGYWYWNGTEWVLTGGYNLPSIPPNPWNNHRVWWDRDGVDPWQNDETANTGGIYYIEILLHATSDTSGEAYMTIRDLAQGFETDGNWNTIELTPAGMTFTGDMKHLRVFYGLEGYGAIHTVVFEDITVVGHPGELPMAVCFEQSIDIKPGSFPNAINLKSKGRVPVAILSTDKFDATTVDPTTVYFAEALPVRWTVEDVWPYDGRDDLLLFFNTQDLILDESSPWATLIGETYGRDPVWGKDAVYIKHFGK
jgi:hypothetical protein